MVIGDEVIPYGIKNALICFKDRSPTDKEIEKLQPVVSTQGLLKGMQVRDMQIVFRTTKVGRNSGRHVLVGAGSVGRHGNIPSSGYITMVNPHREA